MAVGANIKMNTRKQVLQQILNSLDDAPGGLERQPAGNIGYKAGVPSNNTVADNPPKKGFLLWDATNKHAYICTAWTADASATTWVQIS